MKLSIATLCFECHYAESRYAECDTLFNVMLNANVIMQTVIILDVVGKWPLMSDGPG